MDYTPVYVREVVKRALELSATRDRARAQPPFRRPYSLARRHRHDAAASSKPPAPSGSQVHDHVIVGRTGHASFRALKLL